MGKIDYIYEALTRHKHWLMRDCPGWEGMRADFSYENLRGADLRSANLNGAILIGASLEEAILTCAVLDHANLTGARLVRASLFDTSLRYANLTGAALRDTRFSYTNVIHANFNDSNLEEAIIRDTDFSCALNVPFVPLACPDTGSFIGWKKACSQFLSHRVLVKLEIPEDAKRSSAGGRKCRCSKAKVLSITSLVGGLPEKQARSMFNTEFCYEVGDIIAVDDFDENRWNECAPGIHFFVNRQEAINY